MCHQDLSAHETAPPPPSHNASWGEPNNNHCQSCHLPLADNDCAVCHQDLASHDEPPASHTLSFTSGPNFNHCDSCHFPVADETTCAVCHRRDDHASSPTMPDWHDTISDCLYCHPSQQPINHQVTEIETCVRCHRLQ